MLYYFRRMVLASILAGIVVKLQTRGCGGRQESFFVSSLLCKSVVSPIRGSPSATASYSRPSSSSSLAYCRHSSNIESVGFCIAPIPTTATGRTRIGSGLALFSSSSLQLFGHERRMVSTRRAVAVGSLVKVAAVTNRGEDSSDGDRQLQTAIESTVASLSSSDKSTPFKAVQKSRVVVSPSPGPTKKVTKGERKNREEDSPIRRSPRRRASSKTNKSYTTSATMSDEDGSTSRPLPDFSAFAYEAPVKLEEALLTPTKTKARTGAKSPPKTPKSSKAKGTSSSKKSPKSPRKTTKVKLELGGEATAAGLKTPPTKGKRSISSASASTSGGSNSARKKRIKRDKIEPGSLTPPKDWEKIYQLVHELRADRTAPVDLVGANALPETHLGPKVYRFQVLVSLILSSQTKDAIVAEAVTKMQEHGLTVENMRNTPNEKINEMIFKVGFRNNKTKYLKQCCEILSTQYDGDIPPTAAEMIDKLPGVGPKMAYIVESIAHNRTTGIGVDTHMHRLFPLLEWVNKETATTPERTRVEIEGWLPHEKWDEINVLFVGFGQESQQQKEKMLRKALACSQPYEALLLLERVGLDFVKEGKKYELTEEIEAVMKNVPVKEEEASQHIVKQEY